MSIEKLRRGWNDATRVRAAAAGGGQVEPGCGRGRDVPSRASQLASWTGGQAGGVRDRKGFPLSF
jgi:hypothetical protein